MSFRNFSSETLEKCTESLNLQNAVANILWKFSDSVHFHLAKALENYGMTTFLQGFQPVIRITNDQ